MTRLAARLTYALFAVVGFASFLVLGFWLSGAGNHEPAVFVAWEHAMFDRSALVAWWLTWACYPAVLIPICVALVIVAWRLPAWRSRVIASIVLVLLSWRAADAFQAMFARPRPHYWVVKLETAFSYPSSHAAIVAGFYWLWAALLVLSNPGCKNRAFVAAILVLLGIAICWSRLSLGAHYVTDVIGGLLLGGTLVALAGAVVPSIFGRIAGSVSTPAE